MGLDRRAWASSQSHTTLFDRTRLKQPVFQWWDANQQTNRPHGFAFSKINGGVIRDIKVWKASEPTQSSAKDVFVYDEI